MRVKHWVYRHLAERDANPFASLVEDLDALVRRHPGLVVINVQQVDPGLFNIYTRQEIQE